MKKERKMKAKNINWLFSTPIAHRGLFDEEYPENTTPAFLEAIKLGYAIEFDVQMTADKQLVIYHDDNMLRGLGVDRDIRQVNYSEIEKLKPFNKEYPILLFSEFLKLVDGKVPLLIEIKNQIYPGIEELVIKELESYNGLFALESFNPNVIYRLSKLRPDYIMGVLCTREPKTSSKILKSFMNNFWFKFYVPFDFLSVRVKDLPINYKKIKKYNIITWTIKDEKDLKIAEKYAKNIIFEKTVPSLSKFGEKKF